MTESTAKRLSVFERYLTLWVGLCMVAGIALGRLLPGLTDALRRTEFGQGSHINAPIAVLIWLMIYPMMLKIDFDVDSRRRPAAKGARGHARRELAGQALLDGLPRVALLQAPLPALDRSRPRRPVPGGGHHSRRCPLHGDGLRLVLPDRRRPGLHAGAGLGERPDHARRLRADRDASSSPGRAT